MTSFFNTSSEIECLLAAYDSFYALKTDVAACKKWNAG